MPGYLLMARHFFSYRTTKYFNASLLSSESKISIRVKKLIPFAVMFGILAWIYPFPATNILVLTASSGYQHNSTAEGIAALERLGKQHGYYVESTDNTDDLTEENLKQYQAVIFLNTSGDLLDNEQEIDLRRFIQAGGGFVGIHSAINTEPDWDWYAQMIGGKYAGHPTEPSNVQPAKIYVVNNTHASTKHLQDVWEHTDEWLNFSDQPDDNQVLLAVDELSYNGGTQGVSHPIAWYRSFEGGRIFYTAAGHTPESYSDDKFLKHLAGGIQYVIGSRSPLNYSNTVVNRAPDETRFTKNVLTEGLFEPTEFELMDDGKVLFIQRRGEVRLLDPDSGDIKEIAKFNVNTTFEDGLMGLALDPDYTNNHWIYIYYSPAGDEAVQHLSRFVYLNEELDMTSEKRLLAVNTQRIECCHTGGSIEFGPDGLLYLSTGDNTNPFASNGYGPIDEREGRSPWDAQGSSGNTSDLRGKILRIRPEPDGTYSIPEGNLFKPGEPLTRPEIFVMGNRNPYRISIDQKTRFLYWGEVGPDANEDDSTRGPRGHDEVNQARAAGFFGWPYFVGDNKAYHDHNFATEESGEPFDPAAPINDSPNNTGKRELPPAQKAFIWYPYADSPEFPIVQSGGRNAMAGPVFYKDAYAQGEASFPEYFDGKLFIYDWIRGWIIVVTMDENGDLQKLEPFMASTEFANPIDMMFDKEGVLYVMEYGKAWFSANPDARISRIEYNAGNRNPVAMLTADKRAGAAPLTVNISAEESLDYDGDALTYKWKFAGKDSPTSESVAAHTFTEPGVYHASVQVLDPSGGRGKARVEIKVGNEPPDVSLAIQGNRTFFWDSLSLDYHVSVSDAEDGSLQNGEIAQQDVYVQMDYLAQGFDKTLIVQGHQQADEATGFAGGKRLIDNSDCSSCHMPDRASIGPSYKDVAEMYDNDPEAMDHLSNKIINGGSGVWGETAMAAHPELTEDEVKAMVNYILSHTGEAREVPESLPISGTFTLNTHENARRKEGMYFLRASYTDSGANGIGPITGQSLFVLRHPRIQAETFDFSYNVGIKSGAGRGPSFVKDIYHESNIGFADIDLTGIDSLTFKMKGTGEHKSFGEVEVHLGAPDGKMIGSAEIRMDLSSNAYECNAKIEPQTGQHDLYFVFKDRQDTGYPLFLLDSISFVRKR